MNLLTYSNQKIAAEKSEALGYYVAILHLAPANLSGYETCKGRTRGCTVDCLNTSGYAGIGSVFGSRGELITANQAQRARIARTRMFFEHRDAFLNQLVRELQLHVKRAAKRGLRPAVRLNGTSDIAWEAEAVTLGTTTCPNLFALFPDIQFYDYTKRAARMRAELPRNYHLTFSRAETLKSQIDTMHVLQAGGNVAAVFRKKLPPVWNGYRVIDGVSHDLRFLDPANVVVGLVAKGRIAKRSTSGFILN
jgi:hypothetical protein